MSDGSKRVRMLSKLPLKDDEENVVGLVGVSQDITDRKRAELAMFQAQKLESLGVLAGGIAHDFNNILVSIIGNAGLALMNLPEDAGGREEIRQIETAGQRAAELCRQMLAYAGRAQLVVENIDLNALVDDMAHLAQVSIAKQCVLSYRLAEVPPVVVGDPGQIQQVVLNLVINASEAIGDKRGVITISTGTVRLSEDNLKTALMGEEVPAGEYAFLDVADTGSGMDKETLRRIFDPFFTTKFTGRGLGLAAVLGIVRGHQGALRVDSLPGQGTTFCLLLPPVKTVAVQPPISDGEAAWRGHGTVLVIDDEPDIRQVTGKMLEGLGFSVLSAANGQEGVETFQERADEISAVLLDLTMPVMTGEEALQQLLRVRKDVVVLLMSGYDEQELSHRFKGRGVADFVQKPFAPATLREKLQKLVR
jgi:signal transduction histidine kinase/CheY-like chemotaxis protein